MSDRAKIESFFTIDEVAEHFRLCTRSIHRLIQSGELAAVRIGGAIRIAESSINAFLAARSVRKTGRERG